MPRHLLALVSALAISSCTDNGPQNSNPHSSGATPKNVMDNNTSTDGSFTGNTEEIPSNKPSRTTPPSAADPGDRKDATLTAGDQSESDADRRITQQIRQAVVTDPGLSTKAKNCTIITIDGVVTLRGSVDTVAERLTIGSKIDGISGVRRVDDNLKIMP